MSDDELSGAIATALRRANPVPTERTAGRRSLPAADTLLESITAQSPRRVRPRVVVAIAVVVALIAAAIAAFALVDRDHADVALPALCYKSADLNAPNIVAGLAGDPVESCRQLWNEGAFGAARPEHFDACVLDTGVTAVFPGESGSVCDKLGLKSLQSSDSDARIEDFRVEVATMVGARCINDADARAIVVGELKNFGLNDWTIAHHPDQPYTEDSPCASVYVDPASRQVFLVPNAPTHPGDAVPAPASGGSQ